MIIALLLTLWILGVFALITVGTIVLVEGLEGGPLWVAGGLVLLALGTTLLIYPMVRAADSQGPCLEYRTSVQYDPATKTTRPYRHCVERGEWTDGR